MIGVVAPQIEHPFVAEFFELFKTPWEFYRAGVNYDVLICSSSLVPQNNARLLLIYGSQRQPFEEYRNIKTNSPPGRNFICFRGERMPIYGNCLLFEAVSSVLFSHEGTKSAAAICVACDNQEVVRIGFDLFGEVRQLLRSFLFLQANVLLSASLMMSIIRVCAITGATTQWLVFFTGR